SMAPGPAAPAAGTREPSVSPLHPAPDGARRRREMGPAKEHDPMADIVTARNWRDLIKPRGLSTESDSGTYGKFVAEPLERGFGLTIGNSLRRVLLSSLQGAAITSVQIEGVEHEFTTIPEVSEDVTDI